MNRAAVAFQKNAVNDVSQLFNLLRCVCLRGCGGKFGQKTMIKLKASLALFFNPTRVILFVDWI